jgi:hypothetical protein
LTKLSFTISNAELVNDNPNSSFALLSLDFFASGNNKHDTYVSEDTLYRTADTIKNCPVVWKYDPILDDVGTHDPEENPCGFIPQDTQITSRKLEDGRTMLSVLSYVWKRYSGKLLEFFRRDGDKPVSVEMSVFDSQVLSGNILELKDYKFEAVTILGSFTTPAIPMAKATVLQFSKEYQDAYKKEFASKYEGIDFIIPKEVKENAQFALDKEKREITTSVSVAMAKFLVKNEKITPEKIRQLVKFFTSKKTESENDEGKDKPVLGFFGGKEGAQWSKKLYDAIEEIDAKEFANEKWVEKNKEESMSKEEEMAAEEEKKKLEMAAAEEEKKKLETAEFAAAEEEKKKLEMAEATAAEEAKKKEEEEKSEGEFSFAQFANLIAYMDAETNDEMCKMAAEELKKTEGANFAAIVTGMYAKMCKMFAQIEVMAKENEDLKKFKFGVEGQQKEEIVKSTLKELSEKVVIPEEAMSEMLASAEKFSFEELDAWKNECKAKSFDFAAKESGKEDSVKKLGLPFNTIPKPQNDIWAGAK